ncbi:MAG: hypothetical protein R2795_03900 [Saprospiraceae bacterium]
MLQLMRDNAEALGISATPMDFANVISATTNMLQSKSVDINLHTLDRTQDTAFVAVTLRNKAGHKFPSGYPARRAFISLLVENAAGDTIFHSGAYDETFEVIGHNADYEPHYGVIRREDEVQIYEQVLGDVNGQVTTVLTRADHTLKDNRIPPLGFRTDHTVYDTTCISGAALNDPDFNSQKRGKVLGRTWCTTIFLLKAT